MSSRLGGSIAVSVAEAVEGAFYTSANAPKVAPRSAVTHAGDAHGPEVTAHHNFISPSQSLDISAKNTEIAYDKFIRLQGQNGIDLKKET